MTTIALGVPYTPWVPEREANMVKLRCLLGVGELIAACQGGVCADFYREFTDRESNSAWSERMWKWQRETGAEWALSLQDDVQIPPYFWQALRAMLSAVPEDAHVIGLTAVHPLGREIARRGHRWYRTPGNVIGWAWAIRGPALARFLEFRERADEEFRRRTEDDQITQWCARVGIGAWHPVPTLVDQDTSIKSSTTWGDGQSLRRSSVNWRSYTEGEMVDPSWWTPSGIPQMLPLPEQRHCWFCLESPAQVNSPITGCGVCRVCLFKCVGASMGIQVNT